MTIVLHRQTHEIFERIYSSISPTVIGLITPALLVSASLSPFFFFEFSNGGVAIIAIIGGDEFFRVFFKEREKENKNEIDYIVSLNLC